VGRRRASRPAVTAATPSLAWSRKVRNRPGRDPLGALLGVEGEVSLRGVRPVPADQGDATVLDATVLDADLGADAGLGADGGRWIPVGDVSLGSCRRAWAIAAIRSVTARGRRLRRPGPARNWAIPSGFAGQVVPACPRRRKLPIGPAPSGSDGAWPGWTPGS
jgi:hypothetical protein